MIISLLLIFVIPPWWCGREAKKWLNNDPDIHKELALKVEEWTNQSLEESDYKTGSSLFNGEWLFGTYMMAGMGFGQMALIFPKKKEHYINQMGKCIKKMLEPSLKDFDKNQWGCDPISTLDDSTDYKVDIMDIKLDISKTGLRYSNDHAAYLGYLNLVLSFHRLLDKESEFRELNDKITDALVRRLEKTSLLLLQTYPDERYMVDNCAVIGSIGLYFRATNNLNNDLVRRWTKKCRSDYIDKKTGIMYESISDKGKTYDYPRGSGTTLGLYFLSFADVDLSKELYNSLKKELACKPLGFGAVREYPRDVLFGRGDIDSGPVIFGYGFSATGFAIAGTRVFEDDPFFKKLYATTYLFGVPYCSKGKRGYVTGGPLGTAILFSVLTALPESTLRKL